MVDAHKAIVDQGTQLQAQESAIEDLFGQVKTAAAKVPNEIPQTGITALQNFLYSGTMQTVGDPVLNNYLGILQTTLTKYARVVAGQTGAGSTAQTMNTEVQGLINKGLTVAAVNSYIDSIAIPEMKTTVNGYTTSANNLMQSLGVATGQFNPDTVGIGSITTPQTTTSGGSSTTGTLNASSQSILDKYGIK